jgi:sugar/nucleoside kinase (ribokinase family)
MAREKLLRESINISHFAELPSPQTGVALVMVEAPTGRYMIAVAKSANSEISTELVRDATAAIKGDGPQSFARRRAREHTLSFRGFGRNE